MDVRHILCGLLLVSRVGDIGTTYLATPTLALEANPIARKLGWRFALLTLAACLLPYLSVEMAAMALMPFLFVSASNAGKVWMLRTMGEQEYLALLMGVARKSKLRYALLGVAASCSFVVLAGVSIIFFCPGPSHGMAFWFGSGIVVYAVAIGIHGSLGMRRIFERAALPPAA